MEKIVRILGTRGIPAAHGGFETFAQELALYLSERRWRVSVYCQDDRGRRVREERWQGVRLVHVPSGGGGALGTIRFDWRSVRHATTEPGLVLTLGYNTACFALRYRLHGIAHLMNMDGLEWRRAKWGLLARAWLYLNERAGCHLANRLIADHPVIADHLATRVRREKIATIAYGARAVTGADPARLQPLGLTPDRYALIVARPEPENSILEMVGAFCRRPRGIDLAVLGSYGPRPGPYQRQVLHRAGPAVRFLGPLYERPLLDSLRRHARLYLHGHRVGGTNPALVEALGCSMAVLAHDNPFNRWVAGPGAHYFGSEEEFAISLEWLLADPARIAAARAASKRRFDEGFAWPRVLGAYEDLLASHLPHAPRRAAEPPPRLPAGRFAPRPLH